MNKKLNNLIKFLRSNGLEKYAGDIIDFQKSGGNPLEKITEDIHEDAMREMNASGIYMVSPGFLANIYIELINYLKEHKTRYSYIIKNHFYDEMINKLNVARFTLEVTRDYINSQTKIEGLEGAAARLDEKMKTPESKEGQLKYVDSMIEIFNYLVELKNNVITEEEFSENISEIVSSFESNTSTETDEDTDGEVIPQESQEMQDYRREREARRMLGMGTGRIRRFDVFEGGKEEKDEEELWKELEEKEIDFWPGDQDEQHNEFSESHSKMYEGYDPDKDVDPQDMPSVYWPDLPKDDEDTEK